MRRDRIRLRGATQFFPDGRSRRTARRTSPGTRPTGTSTSKATGATRTREPRRPARRRSRRQVRQPARPSRTRRQFSAPAERARRARPVHATGAGAHDRWEVAVDTAWPDPARRSRRIAGGLDGRRLGAQPRAAGRARRGRRRRRDAPGRAGHDLAALANSPASSRRTGLSRTRRGGLGGYQTRAAPRARFGVDSPETSPRRSPACANGRGAGCSRRSRSRDPSQPALVTIATPLAAPRRIAWKVVEENGAEHGGTADLDALPIVDGGSDGGAHPRARAPCGSTHRAVRLSRGLRRRRTRRPGLRAPRSATCRRRRAPAPGALRSSSIPCGRARTGASATSRASGASRASAAGAGADLVGLNPLHAASTRPRPDACSPYSPSSRFFLDVAYLDPEAIPEFAECERARALVAEPAFAAGLAALRAAPLVDYAGVWRRKDAVLRELFAWFRSAHVARDSGRARTRSRRSCGAAARRWPIWPAFEAAGDAGATERAGGVAYFQYLQWNADEQLAAAARACDGMRVGLYRDLAVGSDPAGADAWSDRRLHAAGVSIGAPPDELNVRGQTWGLAPLDPLVLRERGLRAVCAAVAGEHGACRRTAHRPRDGPGALVLGAGRHAGGGGRLRTLSVRRVRWPCSRSSPFATAASSSAKTWGPCRPAFASAWLARASSARASCSSSATAPAVRRARSLSGALAGRGRNARPPDAARLPRRRRPRAARPARSARGGRDAREKPSTAAAPTSRSCTTPSASAAIGPRTPSSPPSTGFSGRRGRCSRSRRSRTRSAIAEQVNVPGTTWEHPNWRRRLQTDLAAIASDERFAAVCGALRDRERTAHGVSPPRAEGVRHEGRGHGRR